MLSDLCLSINYVLETLKNLAISYSVQRILSRYRWSTLDLTNLLRYAHRRLLSFSGFIIFWFLDFDLFQVNVQLVSKCIMDYTVMCCWMFDCNIGLKLDLVVKFRKLFS
jgi:hypothetical protein